MGTAEREPRAVYLGGLPGRGNRRFLSAWRESWVPFTCGSISSSTRMRGAGIALNGRKDTRRLPLAEHNLALGLAVVADSVNPIEITREAGGLWRCGLGVQFFEIEFLRSDSAEHRQRVETRPADIAGFELPPGSRWLTASTSRGRRSYCHRYRRKDRGTELSRDVAENSGSSFRQISPRTVWAQTW